MTAQSPVKIWLNPPKFWHATSTMRKAQADQLLNEVIQLAERGDLAALRRYDFVEFVELPIWNRHLAS